MPINSKFLGYLYELRPGVFVVLDPNGNKISSFIELSKIPVDIGHIITTLKLPDIPI